MSIFMQEVTDVLDVLVYESELGNPLQPTVEHCSILQRNAAHCSPGARVRS